jgi:hypothetical protein
VPIRDEPRQPNAGYKSHATRRIMEKGISMRNILGLAISALDNQFYPDIVER